MKAEGAQLARIAAGRTDLLFDWLAAGGAADAEADGASLAQWCAYYGDVSGLRKLLEAGAPLAALGDNFDLNGASFHSHWRLCEFLLEHGADANFPQPDNAERPLHVALCSDRRGTGQVVKVLLAHGADPNVATIPGVETGCFMRDIRTRGETPLHRAAAFADEATIQQLLDAGAKPDARDANGDSPLTWASWHNRPRAIQRRLCFGPHRIRADGTTMEANLLGQPHGA